MCSINNSIDLVNSKKNNNVKAETSLMKRENSQTCFSLSYTLVKRNLNRSRKIHQSPLNISCISSIEHLTRALKMASKLNSVQEFYENKTIFLTGASGFMGKVLIEKLLYSCSDLKEIIILMRPKRGKSAMQRVEEFSKLPVSGVKV